jgi:hypothetical protein
VVVAGEPFVAEVRLTGARGLGVAQMRAFITRVQYGGVVLRERAQDTVGFARAEAEGVLVWRPELRVSRGGGPTYRGTWVISKYELAVVADLGRGREAALEVNLEVQEPSAPAVAPRMVRNATARRMGGEPALEVSLAADRCAPGDRLVGAFAVLYAEELPLDRASISLVGCEHGGARGTLEVPVVTVRPVDPPELPPVGVSTGFTLEVPDDAFPSVSAQEWGFVWKVVVEVFNGWFRKLAVEVPVTVVAPGAALPLPGGPPPVVGSEQVRALWAAVAKGSGLAASGTGELRGQRAGSEVAVWRARDGTTPVLRGTVFWKPLELDLEVRPRRVLELAGAGLAIGPDAWQEQTRVSGREPEQVRAFLEDGVLAPLVALGQVRVDDGRASVTWRDAGTARDRVGGFVARLLALADAVAAARLRILPPAPFATARAAWEALAARMEATLSAARMTVDGRWMGMRARLRTSWSPKGRPEHTVVSLHPEAVGAGADARAVEDAQRAVLAHSVAERVEVTPEGIFARLPAPLLDPAPVVDVLDLLARLAAALRAPAAGPYR